MKHPLRFNVFIGISSAFALRVHSKFLAMIPIPFGDLTESHAEFFGYGDLGGVIPDWISLEVLEEHIDLLSILPDAAAICDSVKVLLLKFHSCLNDVNITHFIT